VSRGRQNLAVEVRVMKVAASRLSAVQVQYKGDCAATRSYFGRLSQENDMLQASQLHNRGLLLDCHHFPAIFTYTISQLYLLTQATKIRRKRKENPNSMSLSTACFLKRTRGGSELGSRSAEPPSSKIKQQSEQLATQNRCYCATFKNRHHRVGMRVMCECSTCFALSRSRHVA